LLKITPTKSVVGEYNYCIYEKKKSFFL